MNSCSFINCFAANASKARQATPPKRNWKIGSRQDETLLAGIPYIRFLKLSAGSATG